MPRSHTTDFEQTCNGAIQYLFNAAQTQTNTYIHDNVIDSKTGIQFMPYHLNEGNQNGGKPTVFVTADMLPRIEKNVRNVDTDLVVLVAYRSATDETFKLAEGVSIDLTKNYTQGVAPTIDVEVQAGAGAPSVDEASAGTRITVTVKPDAGYELDELTVTDAKNKDLKVTKRSETTYTFHMADSKVTVEASFKLIETEPENPSPTSRRAITSMMRFCGPWTRASPPAPPPIPSARMPPAPAPRWSPSCGGPMPLLW